jgi:hypothetical protein
VLGKKSGITTSINTVSLTTEVKTKSGLQMNDSEKARWRQALLKNKDNACVVKINAVSPPACVAKNEAFNDSEIIRWRQALTGRKSTAEGKKQTLDKKKVAATQPQHKQPQQPAITSKEETTTDQITWTRDLSIDRVDSGPKNSLYVKVNFEHAQGGGTANALVDSGATENFIDIRTAERWGLPQRTLPNPRPIVNVDGTENKAGAVTRACILNVQYQKGQQLQRFYITDLGFDRVLLRYPWLYKFNPHIN